MLKPAVQSKAGVWGSEGTVYGRYRVLPGMPVLPEPKLAPAAMMAGSHSAGMTAAVT